MYKFLYDYRILAQEMVNELRLLKKYLFIGGIWWLASFLILVILLMILIILTARRK